MTSGLISAADNIYKYLTNNRVDLDQVSPGLPLKASDWGVIWFDEFYDEKHDVKVLMNPACLSQIEEAVLSHSEKREIYFYDGKRVSVLNRFIDLSDSDQVYQFVLPFFAFDHTSDWMIEFNLEGCNFYGDKIRINNLVHEIGGVDAIQDMIENSLREWSNVREVSEKESLYYRNLLDRLVVLVK